MEIIGYIIKKVAIKHSGPQYRLFKYSLLKKRKTKKKYQWVLNKVAPISGDNLLQFIRGLDGFFIDKAYTYSGNFDFLKKHISVAYKDLKSLPKRLK